MTVRCSQCNTSWTGEQGKCQACGSTTWKEVPDEVDFLMRVARLTPQRKTVLRWLMGEMDAYSNTKWDNRHPEGRPPNHYDENLDFYGFSDEHDEAFWWRQVTQYFSRAKIFGLKGGAGPRGQQALLKGLMTLFDCCAAMVRLYGTPPAPGKPSGEIEEWT